LDDLDYLFETPSSSFWRHSGCFPFTFLVVIEGPTHACANDEASTGYQFNGSQGLGEQYWVSKSREQDRRAQPDPVCPGGQCAEHGKRFHAGLC
jgi:hypothetical protein